MVHWRFFVGLLKKEGVLFNKTPSSWPETIDCTIILLTFSKRKVIGVAVDPASIKITDGYHFNATLILIPLGATSRVLSFLKN